MSGRTVHFHMCYVAVSNISNFAVFPPTENVNGKIKLPLYYAYRFIYVTSRFKTATGFKTG